MSNLEEIFAHNSTHEFLNYTRTMVALVDPEGRLLEWNPAFEIWKAGLPSAVSMQDFLNKSSQALFNWMLLAGGLRQARLQQVPEVGSAELRCLADPLSDGNFLFCIELIQPALEAEINRMKDELEKTRQSIKNKKMELEALLLQAQDILQFDPLTRLPNRQGIITELQREISRAERQHAPLTILLADIDHFKDINDSIGENGGDQVLKAVCSLLQSNIRLTDRLGRFGGDEFLFLLPSTSLENAQVLAERLTRAARELELELADGKHVHITISIGAARYQAGDESGEALLSRAGRALTRSKADGRDRWSAAEPN